jgi:hypothetical protein
MVHFGAGRTGAIPVALVAGRGAGARLTASTGAGWLAPELLD